MSYQINVLVDGEPNSSDPDVMEGLDDARQCFREEVGHISELMEKTFPGMVIATELPRKEGRIDGVRIMATDGQGGRQGNVYIIELLTV